VAPLEYGTACIRSAKRFSKKIKATAIVGAQLHLSVVDYRKNIPTAVPGRALERMNVESELSLSAVRPLIADVSGIDLPNPM
jgi:hypothetical protein